MLSVRNILVEMICELSDGEGERWVLELEDIAKQARKSYEGLRRLTGAISELSRELEESLCALEIM